MKNIIILFLAAKSENCPEEDTEVISGRSGIVDSLSQGLFLEAEKQKKFFHWVSPQRVSCRDSESWKLKYLTSLHPVLKFWKNKRRNPE